ncbi:hypothetical protein HS041_30245 [Planomonospora sp. ID67723]|uniref:hypothetical protein n=1 Tax=Planomonospora sp. ID67723 TaxID=2738134 RepID=UPI0018C3B940|nr:hypothetical protein [Planomonospora sp. ID67723]MBG0831989.1 hypothetical protein [Planomonospora sp. ID67723]
MSEGTNQDIHRARRGAGFAGGDEAGGLGIDPRPVALTGLLRETIDDHRAAAKRLTVSAELAPGLHRVPADRPIVRPLR